MKLKALSHYDSDLDTRFGDCILIYDTNALVAFDCGHTRHAEEVETFLLNNPSIRSIYIVVSHNDSDHTDGVCTLLEWLSTQGQYTVAVYTHQYLKYVDTILDKVDDGRRNRESLKRALLEEFNHIDEIIACAKEHGFSTLEAAKNVSVSQCKIVGPTEDEFTDVAAKAVDNREGNTIGTGDAAETVMNAASVQLKCPLDDGQVVLLCGDASPDYLKNLDSYDVIQLPHHGQLEDAKVIFGALRDPDSKTFLISDNTGSGKTSGGSVKLKEFMANERYKAAFNTQNGVVSLPKTGIFVGYPGKSQGVKLGEMDCKYR